MQATQAFLADLKASKQSAMEAWAQRQFVGDTPEATMQANVNALGSVSMLTQIIDMIEDLKELEL